MQGANTPEALRQAPSSRYNMPQQPAPQMRVEQVPTFRMRPLLKAASRCLIASKAFAPSGPRKHTLAVILLFSDNQVYQNPPPLPPPPKQGVTDSGRECFSDEKYFYQRKPLSSGKIPFGRGWSASLGVGSRKNALIAMGNAIIRFIIHSMYMYKCNSWA